MFDGYQEELSTTPHRWKSNSDFTRDMVMKSKKEDLLSNKDNKQRFIRRLGQSLEHVGCEIHHAKGYADVLIVETTVQSAMSCCETTSVGDDTDLLVLLCFHVKEDSCEVFFKPEIRSGTKKSPRWWNIKYVLRVLGRAVCKNLLFAHMPSSSVIQLTSRVFSIGIGLALKHIRSDNHFIIRAEIFLRENATLADISSAGEAALLCLYTSALGDTLDKLRSQRFYQKVATSTHFVQPENLPPTSSAAKYHSLRVYPQVQIWKGESRLGPHLHPQNLGWKAVEGKLLPVQSDKDVSTKALLKVVRCNCKMGCDTQRCFCRKAGLDCSTGCGECRGICANMYENITLTEDNEYEEDT